AQRIFDETKSKKQAELEASMIDITSPRTGERVRLPKDFADAWIKSETALLQQQNKPPMERNIDPLSPTGIAARQKVAQFEAELKPENDNRAPVAMIDPKTSKPIYVRPSEA